MTPKRVELTAVPKLWGQEIWVTNTRLYCCKRLILNQGWQCSLHYHPIKDETFHILSGKVRFELGAHDVLELNPGDTVHVPPQTLHRFAGLARSEILEVSTYHCEDDVVRQESSRQWLPS